MSDELRAGFETGNLKLVRCLGHGGMGTVWLAEHKTLRIRVAVKFVTDTTLTTDAFAVERFAREAELLARVKSPHIVQILDRSMTNSGTPYLIMELLEGETLSRHIARNGGASLELVRRMVEQVGDALSTAHALGVIHRDVKPENIFVARTKEVLSCKLFDFGVAKEHMHERLAAITENGSMVGTPSFMSPEQFAGSGVVDAHVDMWGLAVVTYICLTGTRPFAGRDLVELCRNVLKSNYAPPSQHAATAANGTSSLVDAWFKKAFAPRRENRFQEAATMVSSFLAALADEGTGAPRDSEFASRHRGEWEAGHDQPTSRRQPSTLTVGAEQAGEESTRRLDAVNAFPPTSQAETSFDETARSVGRGRSAGARAPHYVSRLLLGASLVSGISLGTLAYLRVKDKARGPEAFPSAAPATAGNSTNPSRSAATGNVAGHEAVRSNGMSMPQGATPRKPPNTTADESERTAIHAQATVPIDHPPQRGRVTPSLAPRTGPRTPGADLDYDHGF